MTSNARDIRYGRRGGRWLDKPAEPARPTVGFGAATCPQCGNTYRYRHTEPPASCGRLACHAATTWTPQEWGDAARFAAIRHELGLGLNQIDHTALHARSHT